MTKRRAPDREAADAPAPAVRVGGRRVGLSARAMRRAISAARRGLDRGHGPFGACVTDFQGRVLACATNSVVESGSPVRHAEVNAIERACRKRALERRGAPTAQTHGRGKGGHGRRGAAGDEPAFLERCVLYTTTEPCLMCRGAAYWARIPIVAYGTGQADARRAGFDEINLTDAEFSRIAKRKTALVAGFLRGEAARVLEEFTRRGGRLY